MVNLGATFGRSGATLERFRAKVWPMSGQLGPKSRQARPNAGASCVCLRLPVRQVGSSGGQIWSRNTGPSSARWGQQCPMLAEPVPHVGTLGPASATSATASARTRWVFIPPLQPHTGDQPALCPKKVRSKLGSGRHRCVLAPDLPVKPIFQVPIYAIHRIAPRRRESAPRPKAQPETKTNTAHIRPLSAVFRTTFRLIECWAGRSRPPADLNSGRTHMTPHNRHPIHIG